MATTSFQQFLDKNGLEQIKLLESQESTHTAQQAADVHGVPVSNIVKSLLTTDGKQFFMILTPGDERLDLKLWAEKLDVAALRMANADEVKSVTGYSIGGVPPFGHLQKIETYIEEGFDPEKMLVAAAGSANCVFKISLEELKRIVAR